jgi:hypothetical protein
MFTDPGGESRLWLMGGAEPLVDIDDWLIHMWILDLKPVRKGGEAKPSSGEQGSWTFSLPWLCGVGSISTPTNGIIKILTS